MKSIPTLTPAIRKLIAWLYGITAWMTALTGWAYLPWTRGPAELPAALAFSTALFPLWVWGGAWSVAGWWGIAAACTQLKRGWFAGSLAAMCFMHGLWFCFYAYAYFAGDTRSYVSAVIYLRPLLLMVVLAILITKLRPKPTR